MTQLDVVYRYGTPPTEQATLALAKVRDVYGVRALHLSESEKTIRVEYDASRLTEATIHQFLRRAGLDLTEKVPMLIPPAQAARPPEKVDLTLKLGYPRTCRNTRQRAPVGSAG